MSGFAPSPDQQPSSGVPGASPNCTNKIVLSGTEFLDTEFVELECIAGPICKPAIIVIHGATGTGKTLLATDFMFQAVTGGNFLAWQCEAFRRVLYIDGEMGAEFQSRVRARFDGIKDELESIHVLSNAVWEKHNPDEPMNLDLIDHQKILFQCLDELPHPVDIIILDNLSSLVYGLDWNKAEAWDRFLKMCIHLRNAGYCVVVIMHEGKDTKAGPIGSSRLLYPANLGIKVSASDPEKEKGQFNVSFSKHRAGVPDPAQMDVQITGNNYELTWTSSTGSTPAWVITLKHYATHPEQTQAEIARARVINQTTVGRHIRQAKESGYIDNKGLPTARYRQDYGSQDTEE